MVLTVLLLQLLGLLLPALVQVPGLQRQQQCWHGPSAASQNDPEGSSNAAYDQHDQPDITNRQLVHYN
jgi:hypothetical protein